MFTVYNIQTSGTKYESWIFILFTFTILALAYFQINQRNKS